MQDILKKNKDDEDEYSSQEEQGSSVNSKENLN